jgi:hypothetical protein
MTEKKKSENPFPNVGIAEGPFQNQTLTAAQVAEMERDLQVMEDLDKIHYPMEVTLYGAGNRWFYRNDAWRQHMSNMDIVQKEQTRELIKKNKK